MKKVRVVVADDHPVVCAGLVGILSSCRGMEVVGTAHDGMQTVDVIARLAPEVALVDLRMPLLDGVGVIETVRARGLSTRVIILTTYDNESDVVAAMKAGASGYMLKDAAAEELLGAIQTVATGGRALCPAAIQRLEQRTQKGSLALSVRELEVLQRVAKGQSNREIGDGLHVSEATVKTHLIHIFAKLGVSDRTAAVAHALRVGMLSSSDP